jgi:hypothetical protein
MQRFSNALILLNKDFESGKIKVHNVKDLVEYWVYRPIKSSIVGVIGQPIELGETELYAIIVCMQSDHIVEKLEDKIIVRGVKFTNDVEGNDLEHYRNRRSNL